MRQPDFIRQAWQAYRILYGGLVAVILLAAVCGATLAVVALHAQQEQTWKR